MEKWTIVTGIAVPWLMPNVDTDTITPMRRLLLNIDQLGKYSFEPFRFIDGDGDKGVLDPDFPLNMPRFSGAKFMIVGENFGCGSSRETAPEAIARLGIRALIGSSFGGIFTKNCFQQGLLPVCLPKDTVSQLAAAAMDGGRFTVNLHAQRLITPVGESLPFTINETRREMLLNGLSDVDVTLEKRDAIQAYQKASRAKYPWLYG